MTKLIASAALAFILFAHQAEAGGFFDPKTGVIRGDVGRFVTKRVNPVATPMLRQAVVQAGRAGGNYVCGPACGEVGAMVGQGVNYAAGERPPGYGQRYAHDQSQAYPQSQGLPEPQYYRQPMPQPMYGAPHVYAPPPVMVRPVYAAPVYAPPPVYAAPMYRPMPPYPPRVIYVR